MSILDRLLGRKPTEEKSSANTAKQRLSILMHNEGNSEFSRELEAHIKKSVLAFYELKGLGESLDIEKLSHGLTDEGWLEVTIPIPEDNK